MTVGKEKYTELLDKFRAISEPYITREVIQRLKEENKKKINSARVLEKIQDIKSLLNVLEKRGVVQYNDISVLKCIAKNYVMDRTVDELISDYDKWLEKNCDKVNSLYSCGKSHALLNQKTENSSFDIFKHTSNIESEENQIKYEQYCEPLLPKESCINITSSNFIENINNFTTIVNDKKTPERFVKKRRYITFLIISLILFLLLICIIWFIVKIYYQSAAIIPEVHTGVHQTSMEPNHSSRIHYMSNINVGITAQPIFEINQTQNTANVRVPVTPVDAEKEIQNLIIKKISKRIGKFWKDVCRQLNFPEGEIEEIEFGNSRIPHTFENMFTQALQMYFLNHHSNWKDELMTALTKANRTDLKDTVLEIILYPKNFL